MVMTISTVTEPIDSGCEVVATVKMVARPAKTRNLVKKEEEETQQKYKQLSLDNIDKTAKKVSRGQDTAH